MRWSAGNAVAFLLILLLLPVIVVVVDFVVCNEAVIKTCYDREEKNSHTLWCFAVWICNVPVYILYIFENESNAPFQMEVSRDKCVVWNANAVCRYEHIQYDLFVRCSLFNLSVSVTFAIAYHICFGRPTLHSVGNGIYF